SHPSTTYATSPSVMPDSEIRWATSLRTRRLGARATSASALHPVIRRPIQSHVAASIALFPTAPRGFAATPLGPQPKPPLAKQVISGRRFPWLLAKHRLSEFPRVGGSLRDMQPTSQRQRETNLQADCPFCGAPLPLRRDKRNGRYLRCGVCLFALFCSGPEVIDRLERGGPFTFTIRERQ